MSARPSPLVLLDDARAEGNRLWRFCSPHAIIRADCAEQIPAALDQLQAARQAGHHLAGYFAYELGLAFEPRLATRLLSNLTGPLIWFGVFDTPDVFEGTAAGSVLAEAVYGRAYAGPLRFEWSAADYDARFDRAHALIAAGDIYQANLSLRAGFTFAGDPLALYRQIRARAQAPHGAFIDDGTRHILSFSPELFFALTADGKLTAKPMKGTAPRGAEPIADAAARAALATSPKDRAENLMIVDLLRNDLGRIAQIGSVAVRDLFAVETYPTLHTMVSTVTAQMAPGCDIATLLKALFPCGSITGAPKIRAMEIIAALETSPRGVYCGAIGYFSPDGAAQFNVAIRTLTIENDHGSLGIGGAVVHDSTAASEYAECLLKARYFITARKPLTLIETLRHEPKSGFIRLDRHLTRMAASAAIFGLCFDDQRARAALEDAVAQASASTPLRVRLTLDEAGAFAAEATPLSPAPAVWRFRLSPLRVCSDDLLQRHKTNWRELYDNEHRRLTADGGCEEVIFLNQHGEVAEGTRSNVFVERDGRLLTPPLSAGVLDGCLRRALLDDGTAIEATLMPEDLTGAHALYFGNSLRGLIRAQAI